jgi:hypothetical protein
MESVITLTAGEEEEVQAAKKGMDHERDCGCGVEGKPAHAL